MTKKVINVLTRIEQDLKTLSPMLAQRLLLEKNIERLENTGKNVSKKTSKRN